MAEHMKCERGEGWVESEGEAPIKGGCTRQTQIRGVQCSGFVQVELQVCIRPPWRLTAQIHLDPYGD